MEQERTSKPSMRSLDESQLKRLYFDFVAYRDENKGIAPMSVEAYYQKNQHRYV